MTILAAVIFYAGTCWCQTPEGFQTLAPTETQTLEPTEEDSLPTAAPSLPVVSPTHDITSGIATKAKDGPIEEFEPRAVSIVHLPAPTKQQEECRVQREPPKMQHRQPVVRVVTIPTTGHPAPKPPHVIYLQPKVDTKSVMGLISGWAKRAGAAARSYADRRDERVLAQAKQYVDARCHQLSQELGGVKQTQQQQKRAIKLVSLRETKITIGYLVAYVVLLCLIVKTVKLCLRQSRRQ